MTWCDHADASQALIASTQLWWNPRRLVFQAVRTAVQVARLALAVVQQTVHAAVRVYRIIVVVYRAPRLLCTPWLEQVSATDALTALLTWGITKHRRSRGFWPIRAAQHDIERLRKLGQWAAHLIGASIHLRAPQLGPSVQPSALPSAMTSSRPVAVSSTYSHQAGSAVSAVSVVVDIENCSIDMVHAYAHSATDWRH